MKIQAVDGVKVIDQQEDLTGLDGKGEEREESYIKSSGFDN